MTREMRPGYYVNDEWFAERGSQARARARHLANETGGTVEVILQADSGELSIMSVHKPINVEIKTTQHYKPVKEEAFVSQAVRGFKVGEP